MDYKVLITDSAIADLREIVEFVAQHDAQAAQRLGDKLIARALSLDVLPERHAFHDERRRIRKMPLPPYLVFYTCDGTIRTVTVLHFWHSARRAPKFS